MSDTFAAAIHALEQDRVKHVTIIGRIDAALASLRSLQGEAPKAENGRSVGRSVGRYKNRAAREGETATEGDRRA